MKEIILALFCYLLGSIPFSYIFSRVLGGVDIRAKGTGNVGATNVLRTLGIKIAVLSLLGDLSKGAVSGWLGLYFGGVYLAAICATMAVMGHCWPVFLGFRGGKGAATGAGAVLVLMPKVFVLLAVIFAVIIGSTRYVSLGSICAAAVLPVLALFVYHSWVYAVMSLVIAVMVIYRHRSNIERLRNGTEKKITEKAIEYKD